RGTPPGPASWWRRRGREACDAPLHLSLGGLAAVLTTSLLRRGQPHADAADGVHIARLLGGLAELASQPGQVDVDGLVRAAVRELPDLRQQLALADDLAGARGQVVQQVELAR